MVARLAGRLRRRLAHTLDLEHRADGRRPIPRSGRGKRQTSPGEG
ncbi:hypothetical protein [Thermogemmatispora tikiterensis]|nr:hypothetical protein [Thermogemmatispora tikiterensis]